MAFDIDTIVAHINKNFFARPQYYTVAISGSGGPASDVPDASTDVMFNCSAINLGGLNIDHHPDKRFGVGTLQNYPNGKSFTEINMTFYESEFEKERKYFTEWYDLIYNKQTRRFNFQEKYVKRIILNQYNRRNQLVYKAVMFECYPTSISPLDRGYALDGPSQITVGFQLTDIQETFFNPTPVALNPFNFLPF